MQHWQDFCDVKFTVALAAETLIWKLMLEEQAFILTFKRVQKFSDFGIRTRPGHTCETYDTG